MQSLCWIHNFSSNEALILLSKIELIDCMILFTQAAGSVEYTDCISAGGG